MKACLSPQLRGVRSAAITESALPEESRAVHTLHRVVRVGCDHKAVLRLRALRSGSVHPCISVHSSASFGLLSLLISSEKCLPSLRLGCFEILEAPAPKKKERRTGASF